MEDYLAIGVQAVWVIDPRRRKADVAMDPGALFAAEECGGGDKEEDLVLQER